MNNPNVTLNDLNSQSPVKSRAESNDIFQRASKFSKEKEDNNNNNIDQIINRSKVNMIMKEDDFNLNNINGNKKFRKKSNFNIMKDLKLLDTGRRATVNFTIFDYYCLKKIKNKKTEIELFNFGINFFKSQMDIINFFNIMILTQIMLAKQSDNKENFLSRTIELSMNKTAKFGK